MENLLEKIRATQTRTLSIGDREIEKLVYQFIEDSDCQDQLEDTVLLFFSLGFEDIELFFSKLHAFSSSKLEKNSSERKEYEKYQKGIIKFVQEANQSVKSKSKRPFHISCALGELEEIDKLSVKNGFTSKGGQSPSIAADCTEERFPYLVKFKTPWKVRSSFSQQTIRRYEEPGLGCQFRHGPFNGTINGLVTYTPAVVAMVAMHGYGNSLPANNSSLFLKIWCVILMVITPYHLSWKLFVRVY